ncbi:hypothetical protein [Comamonas endophytica]|uniref:Uncharacterized protein n=1 Tax=Comamonas endophytica TaxID=2949090 RepID=A0ABY6G7R1_9BURK|nr:MULTISPECIES: hypothetical protein [unclassified Acidovorax]MCD2514492.1 hypothetical protein [Acidovorax sp. D4N7]UYG51072.1 hypothetical protein M9799_13370 [Acidovorax sp. 5MLIR]
MKSFIASFLLLAPVLALAAGTAPTSKAAAKPAATAKKAAAKPAAKAATKKPAQAKGKSKAPVAAAAAAGAAGAAGAATVALALTPDELAIAERVHTGRIACELGAHVNVTPNQQHPGHFLVDGKGFRYEMVPVATTTGTVRLEDKAAGAVWLQIANKSMLMNQKLGQRLADECMSPEQFQVAEAIKKNPPPSVLDAAPVSK